MIDPKELLFSLPTLEDRLPAGEQVEGVPAGAFHLHEDDWRQVEFVGMGEQRLVETELHTLRSFAAQHRKGMGFTEVYVRRSRPHGLAGLHIDAKALASLLPPNVSHRPLVVGSAPWGPRVVNGYAVEIGPGAVLYVEIVGRHLAAAGLPLSWQRGASSSADALLVTIGRTLKLRLVDWPATTWVQLD